MNRNKLIIEKAKEIYDCFNKFSEPIDDIGIEFVNRLIKASGYVLDSNYIVITESLMTIMDCEYVETLDPDNVEPDYMTEDDCYDWLKIGYNFDNLQSTKSGQDLTEMIELAKHEQDKRIFEQVVIAVAQLATGETYRNFNQVIIKSTL